MAKFEKGNKIGKKFNTETAKAAAAKSNAVQAEKNANKRQLLLMLEAAEKNPKLLEHLRALGLPANEQTNRGTINARAVSDAKNGDAKAREYIMKSTGELIEKTETTISGRLWCDKNPFFDNVDENDGIQKD